jgi:hypothetical protein
VRSRGARPLGRPLVVALVAAVALVATGRARAAARIELTSAGGPELELTAANVGDATADDVVPEVLYRHRELRGDAAPIAPGARHAWRFALQAPPPGTTFPAIVRVRWQGGSAVLVAGVPGTDAPEETVRAHLDAPRVAGVGHAALVVENPGARPVAGRAAFVLPDGLTTDPATVPAEAPAGGRVTLPLVIEGRAPPGAYPGFAVLEYDADGAHHTVIARTVLDVVADDPARRRRPLLIGGAALAAALAVLSLALRAGRRRAG